MHLVSTLNIHSYKQVVALTGRNTTGPLRAAAPGELRCAAV